jgi:hypothetical protein
VTTNPRLSTVFSPLLKILALLTLAAVLTPPPGLALAGPLSTAADDLISLLSPSAQPAGKPAAQPKDVLVGLATKTGAFTQESSSFKYSDGVCVTVTLLRPTQGDHNFVAWWISARGVKESTSRFPTTDMQPAQVWSCLNAPRPRWSGKDAWRVRVALDGLVIAEKEFVVDSGS